MKQKIIAGLVILAAVAAGVFAIQAPAQANVINLPGCNNYPNPPTQATWNSIAWINAPWGRGKVCRDVLDYYTDSFYIRVDDTLTDGKCIGSRASYIGYGPWLDTGGSCGPENVYWFYTEPGATRIDGPWGMTRLMITLNPHSGTADASWDLYNDPNGG